MSFRDTFTKVVKKAKGKSTTGDRMYLYDTKENRESTISYLVEYAKTAKNPQTVKMRMLDDYYNNKHKTQIEIQEVCKAKGLPYIPAVIPYPFIHVESQKIIGVPSFEFNGRDGDMDSSKAKIREYVVQYVVENNKLETMNPDNETRLRKLGNAFFKVSFDYGIRGHGFQGDIVIGNPDPSNIFPDPCAYDIDDCEYLDYIYRIHKMKVARIFKGQLDKLGMTIDDIVTDGIRSDTEIYNSQTQDIYDDTMQITEHWFRQPTDGSEVREYFIDGKTIKRKVKWEAGDIGCVILIGNMEVQYIPNYWEKTSNQNKMYPFVKYCTIPNNKCFWDKSEIEPIIDLVDAADREFVTLLLNDNFAGNDIIVMPENVLADGSETANVPGAIWKTKPNTPANAIARLGGLSNLNGGLKDTINFISRLIQQTVGNFDTNMGDAPPANVKTLGGLVEMKEQGSKRQNIKKEDRKAGFARLYELIDWTALEFYDDNRLIYLGAKGEQKQPQQMQQQAQSQINSQGEPLPNMDRTTGPVQFKYNSDSMKILDDNNNNPQDYYPRVDATINVGDGITNSKAFTLSALENLSKVQINAENYKLLKSMVDIMNLPTRKEIKDYWENMFNQPPQDKKEPPKLSIAFKDMPEDAQIQAMALAGLQSKGGLSPELELEQQKIQADINANGVQTQEPLKVPDVDPNHVLQSLSPEELQHFHSLPEEEQLKILQESMGGQQNAM